MSDEPQSVADELIAGLERDATFESVGAIGFDQTQALAKLGRYQLADPYHYILRLAEAANRFNADALWVWTTPGSLTAQILRADEPVLLAPNLLAKLLLVLVGEASDHPQRLALIQLAVAANTARRLQPAHLGIDSIGADGRGHRLLLTGEPELVEVEGGEPGLWFRLEQASSTWTRVSASLRGRPEVGLLHERACWSSTAIYVDNRRVSHGLALPGAVQILDPHGGRLGISVISDLRSTARGCIVLISAGVEVERLYPPLVRPGFFALLELELPRDLGFAQFARGLEFDRAIDRALGTQTLAARAVITRKAAVPRRQTRGGKAWRGVMLGGTLASVIVASHAIGAGIEGLAAIAMVAMFGGMLLTPAVGAHVRGNAEVAPHAPQRLPRDQARKPVLAAATTLALPVAVAADQQPPSSPRGSVTNARSARAP